MGVSTMVGTVVLLVLGTITTITTGHGYHHHHPYHMCTREIETITKNLCRLELEKSCETKTKTFVKITGYEDTDCKEIEVCKHPHGYYGHGLHGYHGKMEAHAVVECEKETKEICKKVPIKEDVTKDIEFCKAVPKKVCEDRELKVPKITCAEKVREEVKEEEKEE